MVFTKFSHFREFFFVKFRSVFAKKAKFREKVCEIRPDFFAFFREKFRSLETLDGTRSSFWRSQVPLFAFIHKYKDLNNQAQFRVSSTEAPQGILFITVISVQIAEGLLSEISPFRPVEETFNLFVTGSSSYWMIKRTVIFYEFFVHTCIA